ncbi:MAG: hypothetical protein AAF677_07355, partial [Pseudomonadota bacterium]
PPAGPSAGPSSPPAEAADAAAAASAASALASIAAGGKAALARGLAMLEARADRPATAALLDAALARQRAHVVGLTGPPGVGKSTLTDALIRAARTQGMTVGVIAVDPSSRRSRGALLGDRTRLARDPSDDGVFVRSMAARDRLGGVAELTFPSVVLMGALMDRVIVETVGVGQSEIEIGDLVDTVLFCAQPGSGDTLQAMKAGVLEIPDVIAVTKADMGDVARQTAADLAGALAMVASTRSDPAAGAGRAATRRGTHDPGVPVLPVSARDGAGIPPLVAALEARADAPADERIARRKSQAATWVGNAVRAEFGRHGAAEFDRRERVDFDSPFAAGAAFLAAYAKRLSVT